MPRETLAKQESPEALAGATGPELKKRARGKIGASRFTEYRIRMERATALSTAISETHPADARQILTAALVDLSAGPPPHTAFGDIREDARWWSSSATPAELLEYLCASLRALGDTALCLDMRKRLFVSLFESFSESDRLAFLRRVDPTGTFVGSKAL